MELWFWALGGLLLLLAALLIKIYLLQKAAREIEQAFTERLTTETNTLIDISSRDRYMRRLAAAVNEQLCRLRTQRHRYQQGDVELKHAVTNIAHDLRTPLTAISGYLELLEEEEMNEAAERYLQIIQNRAGHLAQLMEELFRYSVLLSGEQELAAEPVVVNSVLEESIATCYSLLVERGITPVIKIPQKKVVRMLDRFALARVFANLLHNAVKYSGGDLEITLSETGELTFTNTAPGLNPVQAGKLFDRFYTVEAAGQSTGLGLAIARTLVGQMNGSISAAYEKNRLRICIRFPGEE
ncbi:MAG: HAMP domain-containing histidine kinase [Lachnospiraceae bacterium]|nr:HAMP domain-containing histidine kinase [Lachnospiraceae bacterium]